LGYAICLLFATELLQLGICIGQLSYSEAGTQRHCRMIQGKTLVSNSASSPSDATANTDELVLHHQHAIEQYSKAIRSMRDAVAGGYQDFRVTLLTNLVIICYESYHGNLDYSILKSAQVFNAPRVSLTFPGINFPIPDDIKSNLLSSHSYCLTLREKMRTPETYLMRKY